ncbi:HDIG domain-containing protein [Clostridium sp. DSM 100503]|uniref:HD domain-containing protein n=1 Tax=Clostridium sp. DSM 100503 TaxID=2963282 RepID=UPI00214A6D3A|nr:HD domain-containing protein [Clostridium sp. DSM 100503]MCR1949681.1 HDIG domain-containing protein [Clostridium sp. DSM 100503]
MQVEIFDEINKILIESDKPSIEIDKLMKSEEFKNSDFSIISKLKDIPQEKKFHPEGNVWNHTKMVIDVAAKIKGFSSDSRKFMWAALLHDIGKIPTTKFIKGRYRSYEHDIEGAKMAYELLEMYEEIRFVEDIREIVRFHMHHIYILKNLPFSNITKLLDSKNFNDIILLFICDKLGRGNQEIHENRKSIKEVITILDILEKESNKKYQDLRKNISEIEKIILS